MIFPRRGKERHRGSGWTLPSLSLYRYLGREIPQPWNLGNTLQLRHYGTMIIGAGQIAWLVAQEGLLRRFRRKSWQAFHDVVVRPKVE